MDCLGCVFAVVGIGGGMKCQLYESRDGTEASFSPVESYERCPTLKRTVDDEDMVLVWEVEAVDWIDAMTKYYEFKGWGVYTPSPE